MTDPRDQSGEGAGSARLAGARTESDRTKAAEIKLAKTGLAKTKLAKTALAKTKLAEVVVVCSKCARRQGLRPRAVRDLLKGAAKRAAKDGRLPRKALCVVASGCLGPCPKRALAVATGTSLAEGRIRLIDPAASSEALLAAVLPLRLLPEFGPNARLAPVHPDESSPAS